MGSRPTATEGDVQRFAEVKRLFDEVVDLAPDARAAKLRALTDKPEVIAEVEKLLGQTAIRNTRFSGPIAQGFTAIAGEDAHVGDTLGAWKLVEEIGHGGMGKVFRAQRSDGHFEQRAALKVLRGMPSQEALDYLARERQILAGLPHPNIARLFDGGATPKGRPYLVMEYVEGVPLDTYVKSRKLKTADLLALFAEICDAVSFAHRQLIVHCDLKPANILVEASGRPVLLDFGIARLQDSAAASEGQDARAYTPRYASPEQQANTSVSTLSDVFSLGRILGELLGDAPHEELAAVIARATHDDAAKRYGSVEALATDVRRFLSRRPLAAMPATPAYVAAKFAQRNWPWILAGTFFAATIVMFTVRVIAERDRAHDAELAAVRERDATLAARAQALSERDRAASAERGTAVERDRAVAAETQAVAGRDRALVAERAAVAERNRATVSQETATQLNEFLLSIFNPDEMDAGSVDVPAVKIVDAAQARIDKELKGQPETQAAVYGAMGTIYASLGRTQIAVADLEKAIAIERSLDRPQRVAKLALTMSRIRTRLGEGRIAEVDAREAVAAIERYAGPESRDAAEAYEVLGFALSNNSLRDEADLYLNRAVALREKLDGPESPATAMSLYYLGLHHAGRRATREKGMAELERARGIIERKQGTKHRNYLLVLDGIGVAQRDSGRHAEAEATFRKALEGRIALHGREAEMTAGSMRNLGIGLYTAGRPLEAIPLIRESLEIRTRLGGADTTVYALAEARLGIACGMAGDWKCAEASLRSTIATLRRTLPARSAYGARYQYELGWILLRTDRAAEAKPILEASVAKRLEVFGPASVDAVESKVPLALAEARLGRPREALDALLALEPAMKDLSAGYRAEYRLVLGHVRLMLGTYPEALADFAEAQRLQALSRGANHLMVWFYAADRAGALAKAGRPEEAAKLAREAATHLDPHLVPDAPIRRTLEHLAAREVRSQ